MPAPSTYDYALVRIVPHVERDERINAGAIVFCREQGYLAARVRLDRARVQALAPDADLDGIERALSVIALIAAGDPRGGPIASLPAPERFHWLVAPRSTVTQTSPVHVGLCDDPEAVLARLMATMVDGISAA